MEGMAKKWHSHDHRYYSRTQADALLADKADLDTMAAALRLKVPTAWNIRQIAPAGSGTLDATNTTGTTLTGMDFAVTENSVWQIEVDLPRFTMSGSGGATFRIDIPSGEIDVTVVGTGASVDTLQIGIIDTPGVVTSAAFATLNLVTAHARMRGVLRIGATGGTVYPMIAVATSGDTAVVSEEYLTLRADRVA